MMRNYRDSLIERLRDPEYADLFWKKVLDDGDPELISKAEASIEAAIDLGPGTKRWWSRTQGRRIWNRFIGNRIPLPFFRGRLAMMRNYRDSFIERLRDPEYAGLYWKEALDYDNPELISLAKSNIEAAAALGPVAKDCGNTDHPAPGSTDMKPPQRQSRHNPPGPSTD